MNEARRDFMALSLEKIEQDGVLGDVVECGVWKGDNIILARELAPSRVCWLYDTFAGMTEPEELDVNRRGASAVVKYLDKKAKGLEWCCASIEEVRNNLELAGVLDDSKLRFVVGDVLDTLRDESNIPDRIALLRLDTDWHASTKIELDILYPRLHPGGVLIVDDYGHWQGSRKAVDDYFNGQNVRIEMIDYSACSVVRC